VTKPELLRGRVHVARSGFFEVETARGRLVAKLRGRLKKEKWDNDLVVVGDEVELLPNDRGEASIEAVLPRRTRLSRRHPLSRGREREDVIAANVDVVLVAVSASKPTLRPRFVDRFLAIAEWNRIESALVVTKIDEADDAAAIEELCAFYRGIGHDAWSTSAKSGIGIEHLARTFEGRTAVLVGPSGAGKSSLVNALDPALAIDVGDIGEQGKGKHTTRAAVLHPIGGGFLVDTPGIRELASFAIDPRELASCFREFVPVADGCAFRDCLHVAEPNCAVRAAAERGEIRATRYETYLSLLRGDSD
jgi:ribosome biogenesis GTPase